MRQDRRFQKKHWLDDDRKRMIPVIAIPAIVICLMVIIVFADHRKEAKAAAQLSAQAESMQEAPDEPEGVQQDGENAGDGENGGETQPDAGETEAETMEEAPEETEPENTEPFVTDTFQRDSVPELLDLMKRYFQARTDADAETMNQLYGVGQVSVTELEAQKTRMRSNAKYIQSIENVVTYVVNGTDENSWLVYAVADIRFYSAKKAAPMIMWCYVTRDADGNYLISGNENLTEEQQTLINTVNHSEPVRRLASDVNGRLKAALNEDDDLREIYGVLRDGSPVWKDGEEEESVKILDETEETAGEDGMASEVSLEGTENSGGADGEASGENAGEPGEASGENAGENGEASGENAGENGETSGENAGENAETSE